jgi:RHS repeat-associated protein
LYGSCVRDYIYFGGQLVAEYDTVGQQIYYYTSDQIGSTRIVTNSAGVVVYAAAHDPYGGIQQTWVNAFNPTPKFSGKERDGESDLDYFGARYYDHSLYRFLSVDPKIPGSVSLFNQQRWNLYAYCLGNPANYVDPAGGNPQSFTITIARYLTEGNACYGQLIVNGERIGFTLENDMSKIAVNVYKGTLVRVSDGSWQIKLSYYRPAGVNSNNQLVLYQAAIMEGWDVNKSHGCIFIGKSWLSPGSIIPDGVMTELNNLVKDYIKAMSKQAAAVSAAMTGGNYLSQIGMVLSALDVLSSLGNIQSLWDSMQFELTVTIIDIQKGADQ